MSDDRYEKLDQCYRERLVRHLMRYGRQRQEAEDIAQRALMNTWRKLDSVEPTLEWAYLLTAANHIAYNDYRKANSRKAGGGQVVSFESVEQSTADPRVQVENHAIAGIDVRAIMNDLPPDTRKAVFLRHQGFTSNQIGRTLGLSPTNVRTKLHRAEALFRERLGSPPPGVKWLDLAGEHHDD